MAAPKFNPTTMDIFTEKGRKKFDQYMKEKKLWEQQQVLSSRQFQGDIST